LLEHFLVFGGTLLGLQDLVDECVDVELLVVLIGPVVDLVQSHHRSLVLLFVLDCQEFLDFGVEAYQEFGASNEFVQRLHLVLVDFGAQQVFVLHKVVFVFDHVLQNGGLLLTHFGDVDHVDVGVALFVVFDQVCGVALDLAVIVFDVLVQSDLDNGLCQV